MIKVDRKSLRNIGSPRFVMKNMCDPPMHNLREYKYGVLVTYCGLRIPIINVHDHRYIYPSNSSVGFFRVCNNCKRVNIE